uniref:Uncharacterized protein n=1 Tax=Chenopodium quinoa TaxID=63459 RepID=A0A803N2J4_CHEQI
VMAVLLNKVFIPFEALLEKMTAWLQFPPPVYAFADAGRNNVFLRINGQNSASRFSFYGGDANTAAESRERAAQKAVKKLIGRFGVKKRGIQDASSGQGPNVLMENVHFAINYVQFLGIVMMKTGASVTPIETTWVESRGFISWLMVTCPRTNTGIECIFSDPSPEISIAEQRVAKKAIFSITCKYNLEVVDAKFGAAAKISRECCLMREKFMVLKEHLESLQQVPKQIDTVSCIPDDGFTTPTGEDSQAPVTTVLPHGPVKCKKMLEFSYVKDMCAGTSNRMVAELPELEDVFKAARFR